MLIYFTTKWPKQRLAKATRGAKRPDFISPQRWAALQGGRVAELPSTQLGDLLRYLNLGFNDVFPQVH